MDGQVRQWLFAGDAAVPRLPASIASRYLADETETVKALVAEVRLPAPDTGRVLERARSLVEQVRARNRELSGLDAFMSEYDLSSQEGIVLMCLAEALLRIPDAETADRLIADKLGDADFQRHLGGSESLFVNAATWGLMLTGRVLRPERVGPRGLTDTFDEALTRLGEPVIRTALRRAMRILGHQFVMGRTIEEALRRAERDDARAYRYSFDMLGEAALTARDAHAYLDAYAHAIAAIGSARRARPNHHASAAAADAAAVTAAEPTAAAADAAHAHAAETGDGAAPSISVKLSALCPRFELAQAERAVGELTEHLGTLAREAREAGVALTVDAEEADRLDLTLTVFRRVLESRELVGWSGLGIAVQAYQKRAAPVIDWLAGLAESRACTIPVRLVKGAYWDTEIKRAQEQGLAGYPVFTRKSSTDVSYLACARRLLDAAPHLYPQFATHNAHTVAWVEHIGAGRAFEFQRLHGMGRALYASIAAVPGGRPCRVYAPVGSHEDLLPYLVRRLLENGANTSFVNRIVDEAASIEEIVRDPIALTESILERVPHPRIPAPRDLFGAARRNSSGLNLADPSELLPFAAAVAAAAQATRSAAPIVDGRRADGTRIESHDPSDTSRVVGDVTFATQATARAALASAAAAFGEWNARPAKERAAILRAAAERFETHRADLVALSVAEGGRSVPDSLGEVREAVDFLRYYAYECERLFGAPVELQGPTGERNALRLSGRGVFLCISPWNFPVAIFTGQVAAALAAGNTVLAKPAEQTPIVAARVVELLYDAGVPRGALQFVPGEGPEIGAAVLGDARLAGVAFTGSTETARIVNRALAEREGPIATLIAETGGVNAMIVDSSALPEQVVRDVAQSAFNSAGQRCSALRLLCLQRDTADAIIDMLTGYMAELVIGDPALLYTDVGPVIDGEAQQGLLEYVNRRAGHILYQCRLPEHDAGGLFVPPTLLEIGRVAELEGEVFGPVLHVLRYAAGDVDELVDAINSLGYGLTLGVHSRIDDFAERIAARARIGNVYVNRNMIGAVVGVQPFGGMGLSGTGPKAGGPHYLARFATEQAVSVNTAAVGGNATLLSLLEEG